MRCSGNLLKKELIDTYYAWAQYKIRSGDHEDAEEDEQGQDLGVRHLVIDNGYSFHYNNSGNRTYDKQLCY